MPDGDDQLTSDHGFDITRDGDRLRPIVEQLKGWGCRVSLFMDPDPAQISLVRALGADRVELYTETYARAHECGDCGPSLAQFQEAAAEATLHGLGINGQSLPAGFGRCRAPLTLEPNCPWILQ